MSFVEHPSGLFVYQEHSNSSNVSAYTLLSTVAEHQEMFSRLQVDAADAARALYQKIGRPDQAEFQPVHPSEEFDQELPHHTRRRAPSADDTWDRRCSSEGQDD